MPRFLHLLKGDAPPLAATVIAQNCREPEAEVTVVLLDGAPPPALPAAVRVRRLADDDLDYSALLDLIFQSDHVLSW
ncbi:MAG TPA: hypothetical protein VGT40_09945 [Methylomirabilota bacterium]|jgi:hypothetical protein|nr:hypothetical protein [Methylomirabilota bacterium]